jgi:hypothetical protein
MSGYIGAYSATAPRAALSRGAETRVRVVLQRVAAKRQAGSRAERLIGTTPPPSPG